MSDEPAELDASEVDSGRELLNLGADSLAALAGAAAGTFLGPPGALAGAVAGPAVATALAWVGRNLKTRLLSRNEEVRIGTALYVALERWHEREQDGETPRQDGLIDPASDPRGALEGALLAAARSYDELKVPYIGAFYASFVFDEAVSIDESHFLLNLLDRITYRQMCALAYISDPDTQAERERIQLAAEEDGEDASLAILAELFELANLGLLGARQGDPERVLTFGETYATFGGGIPMVARQASQLALTPLGQRLAAMAELERIPADHRARIGMELGAKPDGGRS
jgi:hypothetical protein